MLARAPWLLVTVLAGCIFEAPRDPGIEGTSCVVQAEVYSRQPARVDLLLVVDRSPAMEPYRDRLIANLDRFAQVLDSLNGGRPDLHVGVVSADLGSDAPDAPASCTGDQSMFQTEPRIDGCVAPEGAYLSDERLPWYTCGDARSTRCGDANFEGSLGDGMSCIGALPPDGCPVRQPLEAALQALVDRSPAGFRRDDALLGVIIIAAGDDGSPDEPAAYAAALGGAGDEWPPRLVSVIAPADAERLRDFVEGVPPPRGTYVPFDQELLWVEALAPVAVFLAEPLGFRCLPELADRDVDPGNPGLQPSCTVVELRRSGDEALVPACLMAGPMRPSSDTPRPCWWLEPIDDPGCGWRPHLEGIEHALYECEATCPAPVTPDASASPAP